MVVVWAVLMAVAQLATTVKMVDPVGLALVQLGVTVKAAAAAILEVAAEAAAMSVGAMASSTVVLCQTKLLLP